jgi:hypothetical protein
MHALAVVLIAAAPAPVEPRFEWAALPIINYTSDFGLGLGARGSLYRFAEGRYPFQFDIDLQLFANTGGVQSHFLAIDLPQVGGSAFRVTGLVGFVRNSASPWYGVGNHGPPDPTRDPSYYRYLAQNVAGRILVRRPIWGSLLAFGSYVAESDRIRFYAGSLAQSQALPYASGGVFSLIGGGLLYDSRDNEGSPTHGELLELSTRTAQPFLGSSSRLAALFASAIGYWQLFGRLVLAGRVAFDQRWGTVPFNHLQDFGLAFPNSAVGGGMSVRGILDTEYVGPTKLVANLESRLHLFGWSISSTSFTLGGVAFLDGGSVWAPDAPPSPGPQVHLGYGGGLRLGWGSLFVIRADVGFSPGLWRAYVDVGQAF